MSKKQANTTPFKIESGIPVPTVRRGRPMLYPWALLEKGDSFFVPNGNVASLKSGATANSSPTGKCFRVFAEEGGVRVFRVE